MLRADDSLAVCCRTSSTRSTTDLDADHRPDGLRRGAGAAHGVPFCSAASGRRVVLATTITATDHNWGAMNIPPLLRRGVITPAAVSACLFERDASSPTSRAKPTGGALPRMAAAGWDRSARPSCWPGARAARARAEPAPRPGRARTPHFADRIAYADLRSPGET